MKYSNLKNFHTSKDVLKKIKTKHFGGKIWATFEFKF